MSTLALRQRAPASPWSDERIELDRRAFEALTTMAGTAAAHPAHAQARERVIALYLPMARRLARRYYSGGEPFDDLFQVAALGLIQAVDRFDPARGRPFAAYAIPTILGELRRHFRDRVYDIRLSRTLHERALRVRSAEATLDQRLGRTPDVPDVAADLGLTDEEVAEAIALVNTRTTLSMEALNRSGTDAASRDRFGGDDPGLANAEARAVVKPLLAALPERQKRIVFLRFFREQTQTEIADELGISQMHVSRLLAGALDAMRHRATRTQPGQRVDRPRPGRRAEGGRPRSRRRT